MSRLPSVGLGLWIVCGPEITRKAWTGKVSRWSEADLTSKSGQGLAGGKRGGQRTAEGGCHPRAAHVEGTSGSAASSHLASRRPSCLLLVLSLHPVILQMLSTCFLCHRVHFKTVAWFPLLSVAQGSSPSFASVFSGPTSDLPNHHLHFNTLAVCWVDINFRDVLLWFSAVLPGVSWLMVEMAATVRFLIVLKLGGKVRSSARCMIVFDIFHM